MRKLMWFSIGFAAACAIGAYLLSGYWMLLPVLLCMILLGIALCIPSVAGITARYVLFGCIIGLLWNLGYDSLYLAPAREQHGETDIIAIEVTDYAIPTDSGIMADGKIELEGKTYRVRFYINQDIRLAPGDQVTGGFRLRYTGGREDSTYHPGSGIFLLAYPKGEICFDFADSVPGRYFPAVLRNKLLNLLGEMFPADTAAFAQALLLGETSGLSYGTDAALKISGIRHVVAVSGLHVSILFALVYMLCGKQRFLTGIIGLPVLLLFAAVAGFSPSILRACMMQALMILSLMINKEYDPPTALSFAVLVILAVNPWAITSVSLQLSAGCMVGIFLFSKPIQNYLLQPKRLGSGKGNSLKARLARWIAGSVSVTLGAMVTTVPLCAWYFGMVSLGGIVTNLLTLWLISFVFYGLMAVCILGVLWVPVGYILGRIISWPIRFILWVATMISKVPVAAVYTGSIYIVIWLVLCYILLFVFKKIRKKHPVLLGGCIAVSLGVALLLSWAEPRMDDYRITAVDVGQGQCLILQNKDQYYMVDCGGDTDTIAAERAAQLLLSQGVFRLDGLIVTHYDKDHAGGVEKLLSRIPTDALYLPLIEEENALQEQLQSRYEEKVVWVEQLQELPLEDGKLTIIPSADKQDGNESSLCVLFQPKNCDILITADRSFAGEQALMDAVTLPDLEILVAGHHGSKTSTSWELLEATRPEIVLISAGEDNAYGHPSGETLERLRIFECVVYRTDLEGTLIFRG